MHLTSYCSLFSTKVVFRLLGIETVWVEVGEQNLSVLLDW